MRALSALLLTTLALLTSCGKAPPAPAKPDPRVALWQVADGAGHQAWIMGTVHALPDGVVWRSPPIDKALAEAGELVFEIGEELDSRVAGAALARLAHSPGLPPPSQRLDPARAADLTRVYGKLGIGDATFPDEESWAVALQLAAIAGDRAGVSPANGVEPELRRMAKGKPVIGLETVDSQFAVFDALPPRDQTALLGEVAHEAASDDNGDKDMMDLWLRGDTGGIARESYKGFLATPGLRQALLTRRTESWARTVDAMLREGHRPFIAVGAAHVSGPDGLPALMAMRGYTVRRMQ